LVTLGFASSVVLFFCYVLVPVVPVRDLNFVKYFAGRRDYVLYPGP
jgi:hypothetical protein